MKACRLCLGEPNGTLWNEPLFESDNFVVIPSLGALVEGWLLLVPKSHFICIGALPKSLLREMGELKATACSFVRDVYGNVVAFEHGPYDNSRKVGCGVDHAHLHIVSISFDLEHAVTPLLPIDTQWLPAGFRDCREAFQNHRDYLYLEQPVGVGRIALNDQLAGQLFRRAIASALGVPDRYNWREHSNLQNVNATIARARAHNLLLSESETGLAA
jgi:diadenosine tetraphosphate (Ap4A) HIT family hydrolase